MVIRKQNSHATLLLLRVLDPNYIHIIMKDNADDDDDDDDNDDR